MTNSDNAIISATINTNDHLQSYFVEVVVKRILSIARKNGSNVVPVYDHGPNLYILENMHNERSWLSLASFFKNYEGKTVSMVNFSFEKEPNTQIYFYYEITNEK